MSSPDYYRLALQQQMLYQLQLEELLQTEAQIEDLKARINSRHKKHRRCDKQISKEFQCDFCQKKYASDIALKLHYKLKHRQAVEDRTGSCSTQEEHLLPENFRSIEPQLQQAAEVQL